MTGPVSCSVGWGMEERVVEREGGGVSVQSLSCLCVDSFEHLNSVQLGVKGASLPLTSGCNWTRREATSHRCTDTLKQKQARLHRCHFPLLLFSLVQTLQGIHRMSCPCDDWEIRRPHGIVACRDHVTSMTFLFH